MNPNSIDRKDKIEKLKELLSGRVKVKDLIPETFHGFLKNDDGTFTCTGSMILEIKGKTFAAKELDEFLTAVPNRNAMILIERKERNEEIEETEFPDIKG